MLIIGPMPVCDPDRERAEAGSAKVAGRPPGPLTITSRVPSISSTGPEPAPLAPATTPGPDTRAAADAFSAAAEGSGRWNQLDVPVRIGTMANAVPPASATRLRESRAMAREFLRHDPRRDQGAFAMAQKFVRP